MSVRQSKSERHWSPAPVILIYWRHLSKWRTHLFQLKFFILSFCQLSSLVVTQHRLTSLRFSSVTCPSFSLFPHLSLSLSSAQHIVRLIVVCSAEDTRTHPSPANTRARRGSVCTQGAFNQFSFTQDLSCNLNNLDSSVLQPKLLPVWCRSSVGWLVGLSHCRRIPQWDQKIEWRVRRALDEMNGGLMLYAELVAAKPNFIKLMPSQQITVY